MTPGLQWFVRHYDRSKPARREVGIEVSSKQRRRRAASRTDCGRWRSGRRLTPRFEDIQDYVRRVGNVAAAWRAQPIGQGWRAPTDAIEVGIVFHFIRNRAGGIDTGLPRAYWGGTHAEPWTRQNEQAGNPSGYPRPPLFLASSAGARTLLPGRRCTARSRSTSSAASTCAPTRWACRTGSWSRLSGASAAPPWRARGRFAASRGGMRIRSADHRPRWRRLRASAHRAASGGPGH